MIHSFRWLWHEDKSGCAAVLISLVSFLILALHASGCVDLSTWDAPIHD